MSNPPRSYRPVLCLDFGGVINSYRSGWQGPITLPDPPVEGAIEFLREACEAFQVAICSARFADAHTAPAAKLAVQAWLQKHGFPGGRVALYRGGATEPGTLWLAGTKPRHHVALDDRSLLFTGTFPTIGELLAFKPWNR